MFGAVWLLVALALPLALGGCAQVRHLQVFRVSIVNDTGGPVVVRNCDHYCSSSSLVFDLQPGARVPINRVAKQHKAFSITTPSGGHVGCLDLYYKQPRPGAQALVSKATGCPGKSRPLATTLVLVALVVLLLALPLYVLRRGR